MSDEPELTEPKPILIPIPVFETAPKSPPRFMVVDDTFIAQTADGEIRVLLRIPSKLLPDIAPLATYLDELKFLLQSRGDEETLHRLGELDLIDVREISRKFSQAYQEKEEARLGESYSSSIL